MLKLPKSGSLFVLCSPCKLLLYGDRLYPQIGHREEPSDGMALQVPLDKVQGSWLGLMTILLACMNMIILLADLCWSMLQAELQWEELSAELVARVAPLLFYMVNLRDIARSPKISWFRIQGFMQNPCSVKQLFEALPERSDTLADEQLRRGMTCVLAYFGRQGDIMGYPHVT